jgi:hypothetical protein
MKRTSFTFPSLCLIKEGKIMVLHVEFVNTT